MKGHWISIGCFVFGAIFVLFGVFAIGAGIIGLIMGIDGALQCVFSYIPVLAIGLLICFISKECYDMEK